MVTRTYRLVLTGQTLGAEPPERIWQEFGKRIGKNPAQVREMLGRAPCTVKAGLPSETARRYKEMLTRLGVECRLESEEAVAEPGVAPDPEPALVRTPNAQRRRAPEASAGGFPGLSLVPLPETDRSPEEAEPKPDPPQPAEPVSAGRGFHIHAGPSRATAARVSHIEQAEPPGGLLRRLARRIYGGYRAWEDAWDDYVESVGRVIPLEVFRIARWVLIPLGGVFLLFGGGSLLHRGHEAIYQWMGPVYKREIICRELDGNPCGHADYFLLVGNTGSERLERVDVVFRGYPLRLHVYDMSGEGTLTLQIFQERQQKLREESQRIAADLKMVAEAREGGRISGWVQSGIYKQAWQLAKEGERLDPEEKWVKTVGPLEPGQTIKLPLTLGVFDGQQPLPWRDLFVGVEVPGGRAYQGDPHMSLLGRLFLRIAD
jgi:hypothetical protein